MVTFSKSYARKQKCMFFLNTVYMRDQLLAMTLWLEHWLITREVLGSTLGSGIFFLLYLVFRFYFYCNVRLIQFNVYVCRMNRVGPIEWAKLNGANAVSFVVVKRFFREF